MALADGDASSSSCDGDDEYQKFIQKMNPPRITIDNTSCANATVVHVDSANKYGILLEVVQVLTDLNLMVKKAYISSDGGWFMDVFNVTNQNGQKMMDKSMLDEIVDYIQKCLEADSFFSPSKTRYVGVEPSSDYTLIELTGTDRPGLISEVSAVLTNLDCNVVNAEVWTHNKRAAAVMQVTDTKTGLAILDTERLCRIREQLRYVFRGSNRNQDDGGVRVEQVRDGQRQGHAAAAGWAAVGRVRAHALRAPHPHHGAQRHGHLPHHLRRLRLGHVPGRKEEQGPVPQSLHDVDERRSSCPPAGGSAATLTPSAFFFDLSPHRSIIPSRATEPESDDERQHDGRCRVFLGLCAFAWRRRATPGQRPSSEVTRPKRADALAASDTAAPPQV